LKAHIKEQAAIALSGTDLSLGIDFEPPSVSFLTDPGPLDALLTEAINEVTGLTPSLSTDGGTSDARFIKEYCPVVEFGLTTASIHKADEHVALADLEALTAVYRRFIALYFETFGGADAG
jgi:succinyl-diaminopimelate desuccinylase